MKTKKSNKKSKKSSKKEEEIRKSVNEKNAKFSKAQSTTKNYEAYVLRFKKWAEENEDVKFDIDIINYQLPYNICHYMNLQINKGRSFSTIEGIHASLLSYYSYKDERGKVDWNPELATG